MDKKTKPGPGAFLRILHFIKPRLRSYMTGFIVFSVTEVMFYISIPLAERVMIDAAIQKDMAQLWRGVFFILGISACGGVSFVLFMYLFCVNVIKLTAGIRTRSFAHVLELPAPYFEKHHSGDTVSRLTNDINTLKNSYDWPLWNFLVMLLSGAGAATAMVILDWRVSLSLIAASAAFTVLNMKFAGGIKKLSAEIQAGAGKLAESMGNILGGFSVIKRFHLEPRMRTQFEDHNGKILELRKKRIAQASWLECYNSLIGWINFGGVLAVGALLAGKKLISFGTMVAMVHLLWNVNRTIRESGGLIAEFHGYLAGAARMEELEREPEEPAESASRRSDTAGASSGAMVEMRKVSFSYDGQRKALADFDLRVGQGQTVALVGPSGGGKSTVFKLLLGFYQPSEGLIALGHGPSGALPLGELRDMIAYVPQEPFMFDGTIAENIGCARQGASVEEIVKAASAAHAHDFITKLEKGYDTVVGERGVKLSGGSGSG